MRRRRQCFGFALLTVSLSACGLSRHSLPSEPLPVEARYASAPDEDSVVSSEAWWLAFSEPNLTAAIETTLSGNLSLAAAQARIVQASAAVRQTRAAWFPSIDATLSANRSRTVIPGPVGALTLGQLQGSLSAAYEVDIWGRTRNAVRAANEEVVALEADREAIAMSLSASVAEVWLTIVQLRASDALIERQLATQDRFIELLERRFVIGTATALDIEQQRGQRDALVSEQVQLRGQLASAAVTLSALQGGPIRVDAPDTPATLPTLPPTPTLGVPLDLLSQRPDVRAAYARAVAADRRVASAVADRLPSLRLAASISAQGPNVGEVFNQLFWNIAASVTAPLVDGGRRRAAVDQAEGALDASLLNWADTLLTAISEVEEAAALMSVQQAYLDALAQQVLSAERSLALAEEQYRFGSGDYLRVLSAVSGLQALERAQLGAQRQQLSYRIQLHRALGGSWLSDALAVRDL